MQAGGLFGCALVARRDAVDDPLMLVDQPADMHVVDREKADAVHLRLDAFDDAPGIGLAGRCRERAVKEFVETEKAGAIVLLDLALLGDLAAQLLNGLGRMRLRNGTDNIGFDRLADEADIHDRRKSW